MTTIVTDMMMMTMMMIAMVDVTEIVTEKLVAMVLILVNMDKMWVISDLFTATRTQCMLR